MKLPCQECGGKCCTPPAMNYQDAMRISNYTKFKVEGGGNFYMLADSWDEEDQESVLPICPAFDQEKKNCSIYPFRPTVCRKYATIKELPCLYLNPKAAEYFAKEATLSVIHKVVKGKL